MSERASTVRGPETEVIISTGPISEEEEKEAMRVRAEVLGISGERLEQIRQEVRAEVEAEYRQRAAELQKQAQESAIEGLHAAIGDETATGLHLAAAQLALGGDISYEEAMTIVLRQLMPVKDDELGVIDKPLHTILVGIPGEDAVHNIGNVRRRHFVEPAGHRGFCTKQWIEKQAEKLAEIRRLREQAKEQKSEAAQRDFETEALKLEGQLESDPVLEQYRLLREQAWRYIMFWSVWLRRAEEVIKWRENIDQDPGAIPEWFKESLLRAEDEEERLRKAIKEAHTKAPILKKQPRKWPFYIARKGKVEQAQDGMAYPIVRKVKVTRSAPGVGEFEAERSETIASLSAETIQRMLDQTGYAKEKFGKGERIILDNDDLIELHELYHAIRRGEKKQPKDKLVGID